MWKWKRRGRDSNAAELPRMSACGWNTWSRRWHSRLWCWRTAGRWLMDTYGAQEFQINHWEPPAALSCWSVCWWGEGFYQVVDITKAPVVPETIETKLRTILKRMITVMKDSYFMTSPFSGFLLFCFDTLPLDVKSHFYDDWKTWNTPGSLFKQSCWRSKSHYSPTHPKHQTISNKTA